MNATHRLLPIFLGTAAILLVTGIYSVFAPESESVPLVDIPLAKSSGPAMCPWREPESDLRLFFPAARSYRTETLALSSIRTEILARLEPGSRIEDNSLYVHRALRGTEIVGSILVRRASGIHGAIEVVTAIDLGGKVAGIRVQRHREPAEVARYVTSDEFTRSFIGLGPANLPNQEDLDGSLQKAAGRTIVRTVKGVLVELDEAEKYYRQRPSSHHEDQK